MTPPGPTAPTVVVSRRGARRLRHGHPWIYRSDVRGADYPAGLTRIEDERGSPLGAGLWSPRSEIRLRRLTSTTEVVDTDWWVRRLRDAAARRSALGAGVTAYRVVHAEGDGLPSLVVDRYGDVAVVQLLSAGIEAVRDDVLAAVERVLHPTGILLRNDASVRRHEGLPRTTDVVSGTVPDEISVREGDIRYLVRPHEGQKTGAFLDQRENHLLMASLARGRCLDVFTYQGAFALQMCPRADAVLAVDSSASALAAARANAALNDFGNAIEWIEANAFDHLRVLARAQERFDTIVLDPPAFAKTGSVLKKALAGYKEINLRAMRLLRPGGLLLTCSCSYHVTRDRFNAMLADAAADSGRRMAVVRQVGQSADHPELLTIPETGYLKGSLLLAQD